MPEAHHPGNYPGGWRCDLLFLVLPVRGRWDHRIRVNSLEPLCWVAPPLSLSQPEGPLPAVSLRNIETSLLDVEETESASSDEALHSMASGFFSALVDRLRDLLMAGQIAGGPQPLVFFTD